MTERILKTCLVTAVLLLATSAPSQAGRYHVYSCRMPDGEVAPTDGWSASKTGTFTYAKNTCETGGALLAALGDQGTRTANTDVATWAFSAPAGETLRSGTLWRAGDAYGGSALNASFQFWETAPGEHEVLDQCVNGLGCSHEGVIEEPFANGNRIAVPPGGHVYLHASCGGQAEFECPTGQGDATNYAAALYLYAADLTLEQTSGPTVTAVGGELATTQTVSGTTDLTVSASDPGSGVYELVFSIDGRIVQTSVPDEAGGNCRNVGQTTDGLPAFLHLQPCPASVSADVPFDTSALAPGAHHLVVSVLDAAGNAAPVLDRMITVPPPPLSPLPGTAGAALASGTPNGSGATSSAVLTARWRGTSKTRLTLPFGRSATITGRLTDPGGAPIAGAQIAVASTPALVGAATSPMRAVRTGPAGTFAVHIAGGLSSRAILLSYTARAGDPQPAATSALQLAVAAPVALSVAPRKVRSRGTIRFRGRLRAGPFPRGGKPVILEARAGRGAWIEFQVVRTDSHGRFRSSYRFKFPGPARYSFRAVCEQEADYPYAAGASRPMIVAER